MRVRLHPALSLIVAVVVSSSLLAQGGKGGVGSGGGSGSKGSGSTSTNVNVPPPNYDPRPNHEFDTYRVQRPDSSQPGLKNEQLPCFRWPTNPLVSGMVSVDRLEVPADAKKEYEQACTAIIKKKLADAEKHLSRAVALFPKFAAAWVLLGQAQEDQGNVEQAQQSCAQGRAADPVYLGSYLCLADLAGREENWAKVAELTDQALALHPTRAPGAYYFNALANLYLKQEPAAEKSALQVVEDAEMGKKPSIHLLLAKIYELKGDRSAEAEQLRIYLKLSPNSDSANAREILRQIESQGADSSPTATKLSKDK